MNVNEFTTYQEISNYITLYKSNEEQIIISYFRSYYDNILFGNKNDEELYKTFVLADKTGELLALAIKMLEFRPPIYNIEDLPPDVLENGIILDFR